MTGVKIMVVEDERIVALHLKQQLAKIGYEVVGVAASGDQALEAILAQRPDVVLMDIHIEGAMDGIETAGRVPPELRTAIIYLTAYSEEATLERARATKPYGYLLKPYSERELHATIQMALERKQSDAALRDSEERFRSIFNAINEGIFIVDTETRTFVEVNKPVLDMFGYDRTDLIGQGTGMLSSGIPPYTRDESLKLVEKALSEATGKRADWNCRRKDGSLFWVESSIRSATIGGREVVLCILRDVTERRAMEAQLLHAHKMEALGEMTGGMAHDFNNLLAVIIGNIDLLREKASGNSLVQELADEAVAAALRGADLTRALLAFARRQPLQPKLIHLKELVGETVKLLSRVLGENIEISLSLAEDSCPVLADPAQLQAALTNLATNARDAMPHGGKLLIATGLRHLDADYAEANGDVAPGDYAMIEVTDSGEGIPPDAIGHIFEPFFTTKGGKKGTGLGLSMVFGFLKQSGGHISVYSEPGEGTTFRLYLPCSTLGESAAANEEDRTPPLRGGEVVLVTEDNAALRNVAVRQLSEAGYTVLEAANGSEALAIMEGARIDLLFTDVVMPGALDGIGLARAATLKSPGLKILLTSGFPGTKLTDNLTGVSLAMLSKPYRKQKLLQFVRRALDGTPPSEDS